MTRWTGLLVAVALVGGLCWWFGLGEVLTVLRRAAPARLALYLLLTAVVTLGYCLRWQLVTRAVGPTVPLVRCIGARLAGDSVGSLLPSAKLAGDPLRAALVRSTGASFTAPAAGVAIDRLLELLGNSVAALAYVTVFAVTSALDARARFALVLPFAGLLVALLALVVRLRRGRGPVARLEGLRRRVPRAAAWLDALHRVEEHLMHFFRAHPRTFLAGVAIAVLTEAVIVLQYHILLSAFGVALELPALLLVLLGGGLARAIPTPGALGALEATQVAMVGAATGRPDLGFVVAVIVRLHETLLLALGLLALALQGVSLARLPRAARLGEAVDG